MQYDILEEKEQACQQVSQQLAQELEIFLTPLLIVLDRLLDKRLVRTFVQCCIAIVRALPHLKPASLISPHISWRKKTMIPSSRSKRAFSPLRETSEHTVR